MLLRQSAHYLLLLLLLHGPQRAQRQHQLFSCDACEAEMARSHTKMSTRGTLDTTQALVSGF
jgi:hypothetical protein